MIEKGQRIALIVTLGVTALILTLTVICFYNIGRLTDTQTNVLGFGIMFLFTLAKPAIIGYAGAAAVYVIFAILLGATQKHKFCVKFLLVFSAVTGVLFLVAQPLLLAVAASYPLLIACALTSAAAFTANFVFIKRAYVK